jgi:hypothetical protein
MLRLLRFAFDASLELRSYHTATTIIEAIGLPNYMAQKLLISRD